MSSTSLQSRKELFWLTGCFISLLPPLSDKYLIPLSPVEFKCCVLIMEFPSKSSQPQKQTAVYKLLILKGVTMQLDQPEIIFSHEPAACKRLGLSLAFFLLGCSSVSVSCVFLFVFECPQIYSASVLKFCKCPELRTKEGFWLASELVKMSGCVVILKNMQTHILKNHIAIAHQFEIAWKMVKECYIIWLLLRTLSQLLQEFLPLQWQCKTILNQNKIKHL